MNIACNELVKAGMWPPGETLSEIAARKIDAGETNPRYASLILERAQLDLAIWQKIVEEARAKCRRAQDHGPL